MFVSFAITCNAEFIAAEFPEIAAGFPDITAVFPDITAVFPDITAVFSASSSTSSTTIQSETPRGEEGGERCCRVGVSKPSMEIVASGETEVAGRVLEGVELTGGLV